MTSASTGFEAVEKVLEAMGHQGVTRATLHMRLKASESGAITPLICTRPDGRLLILDQDDVLHWSKDDQEVDDRMEAMRLGQNRQVLYNDPTGKYPSVAKLAAATNTIIHSNTAEVNKDEDRASPTIQDETNKYETHTTLANKNEINRKENYPSLTNKADTKLKKNEMEEDNKHENNSEEYKVPQSSTTENLGESEDSSPNKFISTEGKWQTIHVPDFREAWLQPPCHCQACCRLFWLSEYNRESIAVIDPEKAIRDVQVWSKNAVEKSQRIAMRLQQHGKSLRKRWEKKFKAAKGQHIKMLDSVQRVPEDAKIRWMKGSRLFGTDIHSSLLLTALNLGDLGTDRNSLFKHLENRSRHPSNLFYADFQCMRSTRTLDSDLDPPYLPGAFNITPAQYGKWQEWEDESIHAFECMAAPASYIVFESQSVIVDVLWEILDNLSGDLTDLLGGLTTEDKIVVDQQAAMAIGLPTLLDSKSMFTEAPTPQFSFQEVDQLCKCQLEQAISQLTQLRSSSTEFSMLIQAALQFQNATSKSHDLIFFHVLVGPYERVFWWLCIKEVVTRLQFSMTERNKDDNNETRLAHSEVYKELMATLRARSGQMFKRLCVLCTEPSDSESLISSSIIQNSKSAHEWLFEYVFCAPWEEERVSTQAYIRSGLITKTRELSRVNRLVNEWAEEALLILRMVELLMGFEPTILPHDMDLYGDETFLHHKLNPLMGNDQHIQWMQARVKLFAKFLPDTPPASYIKKPISQEDLQNLWEQAHVANIRYYKVTDIRKKHLDRMKITWQESASSLDADDDVQTPRPRRRSPDKEDSEAVTPFQTLIPHQAGEDKLSARKLTKRTRAELNPQSEVNEETDTPTPTEEEQPVEPITTIPLRIPLKRASLEVAEALFSNAHKKGKSVRWQTFCNFMRDAGCEVAVSQAGGASTRFVWTDPRDGSESNVNLHKPHPVAILEPQMLKNASVMIKIALGWSRDCFVAKEV